MKRLKVIKIGFSFEVNNGLISGLTGERKDHTFKFKKEQN